MKEREQLQWCVYILDTYVNWVDSKFGQQVRLGCGSYPNIQCAVVEQQIDSILQN